MGCRAWGPEEWAVDTSGQAPRRACGRLWAGQGLKVGGLRCCLWAQGLFPVGWHQAGAVPLSLQAVEADKMPLGTRPNKG